MLLSPATPLTIILLIAFVLLLLSTLSTPIIHAIPIGSFEGVSLGVFGWCKSDNTCSPFAVGYSTNGLFADDGSDFEIPDQTRHALSNILIIHPVATFFTLICLGLATAAHFHGPSHSPRYLLGLLILTIPTLLATLLAFLVDILLFVPHLSWGGWIVLGATILIVISSVMTCAMRRTLVSRKARKKRIEENAAMNGAEYYDNLAQHRMMADELDRAESPPPIHGAESDKNAPQFATFEMKRQDMRSQDGTYERTSDDKLPLTATNGSMKSTDSNGLPRGYGPDDRAPPMPTSPAYGADGRPRRPSRDQYGNPVPPGLPPPGLRHQGSQGSLGSNHSDGYGRVRGGYGPPPRGRGRGFGPPPRGMYGPPGPGRGGFGPPRGGFRGGPPPPGWMGRGRGYGPPMRGRGGMPRPGPPPPGYGNIIDSYSEPPRNHVTPLSEQPSHTSPPVRDEFVAGPALAIGQAIEMDERSGQLSPRYGLDGNDTDVAGMVNMQQRDTAQGNLGVPDRRDSERVSSSLVSPSSIYSDQTYMPPRAQWTTTAQEQAHMSDGSALPSSKLIPESPHTTTTPSFHKRNPSETYYEDVDPRFAIDPASEVGVDDAANQALPSALTPGARMLSPNHLHPSSNIPSFVSNSTTDDAASRNRSTETLDRQSLPFDGSDEQLPDGARSPGEGSEASHFTSISQRGINPNWRPAPNGTSVAAVNRSRKEDAILTANPDFSLPNVGVGRGRGRGMSGNIAPSTIPRGATATAPSLAMGLTPSGRYPAAI